MPESQTQEKAKHDIAETWRVKYRQNNRFNLGAEVEDLIYGPDGKPIGNKDAEESLKNLVLNEGAEPKEREINGKTHLLGTKIQDQNFQTNEEFSAEIDTDYHPAQSEIATEVFQNPADMVFRTENLRNLRDRNLPKGNTAHEEAIMQKFALPDEDAGADKRPKPRYEGLKSRHGDAFDSMGWIASTQLNKGTPVGEDQGIEEFFHQFFNGGDLPSMLDAAPVIDSLFANDPILTRDEGEYKMAAEGGRDMVYDLFVSKSPAVLRSGTERWSDIIDEALPTNENYGYMNDLSTVGDHEDYIEMAMDRPMILSPEVDADNIELLDPDTREVMGTASEELDMESTWVMPGLSDIEESTVSFNQFLEDKQYLGEIMVNGEEELIPVKVDHTNLSDEEFVELAGAGREEGNGYFDLHNTFVRPDIAAKNNGVIEFRSSSNSPRTYEALLSNTAAMEMHKEIQEALSEHRLTTENSLQVREDVKRNGLDAKLPNGENLKSFYREELVDTLAQGVKQSFPTEKLPYTMEMILDEADAYDDIKPYLNSELEDISHFAEFTTSLYQNTSVEPGEYRFDEFESEYNKFVDWFADTYAETMKDYLDEPTEAEKLEEHVNQNSTEERMRKTRRKGEPH